MRRDESKSQQRPRAGGIPALDGLRAISICLVLAAHLLPLGPKSLNLNSTAGPMGMSLFFALSGFLIVSTLRSATILEFIAKRIARILPLVYLYILLVFVVFGLDTRGLLCHLGFIINYTPDQMLPVTEHLWSLSVEVHFYVLMTVLVATAGHRALMLVWPCCLAITAMRVANGAHIDIATHLRMDEILAGACVATLPLGRFRTSAMSLCAWGLAAGAWAVSSHPDSGALQYLRPYAAGILLSATIYQTPNRLVAMLSSPPLRYIAAISYALYVIHPLTAHGWWNDGSVLQRYLLKRPLGLVITLIAAHMSSRYWEAAWIQMARRWVDSRNVPGLQPVGRLENVAGK
jgi:peptidoglycan/LPS O-acetylase OafA/YrhL